MDKMKTLVIINPVSGTRNKAFLEKRLKTCLSGSRFEYEIAHTRGPSHATDLAKEAAENGFEVVMAVGGDGTVNEVACGLVHTDTALGIIPVGSGNGLGHHLGIPTNAAGAIEVLGQSEVLEMDVCTANDRTFFNVAGVGYDAQVAHEFAKKPTRGFGTYIQTVLDQWLHYEPQEFKITTDERSFTKKAMMITLANGSQYGNNAYIAPDALLNDGLMDVCLLYPFPATAVPMIAYQLFNQSIADSQYSEIFRTSQLHIEQESEKAHLDGEPFKLGKKIDFKVIPKALKILAPPRGER